MTLKTLLVIQAIVTIVVGLALIFVPEQMMDQFYSPLSPDGIGMARLYGATALTLGLICWFASNADDSEARQAIVLSFFIGNTVAFILALIIRLAGLGNELGWINVILFLLLALGFGYFKFLNPAD